MPSVRSNKVRRTEDFVHRVAKRLNLVVVDGDENCPIFPQELAEEGEPGVHHAQPSVVTVECLTFLADGFAEPFADEGAVDVVVVSPVLVSGVVGRVDGDALHLAGVVWQQGLECDEVVALHDEVAATGIAAGEIRHVLKQVKGHLQVVVHHGLFPNPVECGHRLSSLACESALSGDCHSKGCRAQTSGTCLLTSHYGHWYALGRTL